MLWHEWSARHPSYDAAATEARWQHYAQSPPTQTGAGKLIALATAAIKAPPVTPRHGGNGQQPPPPADGTGGDAPDPDLDEPPAERPIRFSDNALAFLFTDEHGADLRYVPDWGTWLRWCTGIWERDPAVAVFDAARGLCTREGNIAIVLMPTGGKAVAASINKAATVAAIERLARHHAPHVRLAECFDADPLALGPAAGVATDLDNRGTPCFDVTTCLRPAVREDYFTKHVTVTPANGNCPIWRGFLSRVMAGDQDMIAYLQRACGYCITGLIGEHVLFFLYGTGANGKTTFTNVLLEILGISWDGYAAVAPMSVFTARKYDQHPTELAMLQGKRLVVAHETEEGRAWATARIKAITGGDPITARYMRCDFFTFRSQFKLWILGNHKPLLRTTDIAMRRRLHLVPFEVTIPEAERDQQLPDKLRAEYPQILAWMIEGYTLWRDGGGLRPPERVIAATDNYFQDEDTVATWIAECCVLAPDCQETLQVLFASWQSWCQANGEFAGNRRRLAHQLDNCAGLVRGQDPYSRRLLWHGIKVRTGAQPRP
jgi:P4 family phage/plasmid primase-like protien